jgi:hypothetical protein
MFRMRYKCRRVRTGEHRPATRRAAPKGVRSGVTRRICLGLDNARCHHAERMLPDENGADQVPRNPHCDPAQEFTTDGPQFRNSRLAVVHAEDQESGAVIAKTSISITIPG